MNFPYTRHYQRYEYITRKGYVTNGTVIDAGCGAIPYGVFILAITAARIYCVDTTLQLDVPLGGLWGSRGEGIVWFYNALRTILIAIPFLEKGDKDGWLKLCKKIKTNHREGRNESRN